MWALRLAAGPIRSKSAVCAIARAFSVNSSIADGALNEDFLRVPQSSQHLLSLKEFPCGNSEANFPCVRRFSSHTDNRTAGNDMDDGFSDLDSPPVSDYVRLADCEDDEAASSLLFEQHDMLGSEEDDDERELDQTKSIDVSQKLAAITWADSSSKVKLKDKNTKKARNPLFELVFGAAPESFSVVMDKWIEDGNLFERYQISKALIGLRRRRLYGKALQLVEWLKDRKLLNFMEQDYANHLYLIAKVHGLSRAERYIDKVPESFRNELLYEALLVNCVCTGHIKKAEEIFDKIGDLHSQVSITACNQMILLYKRAAQNKIADILAVMEKENIKPSWFTYQLLIDSKGRSHDIAGMEQIMEMMKADGVEPDIFTKALVAKIYIGGGLTEKAKTILKEMESVDIVKHQKAIWVLLPLYAALGKADDVGRIWKLYEVNPTSGIFLAAIKAWGKLGRIEDAESAFDAMPKKWKPFAKYYNALLNVYADHKLLNKGKELMKKMSANNCWIGPLTWDALLKLYVNCGQVEKADSVLHKVTQQNRGRPLYASYISVMCAYVQRGDVHNTEKIFHELKAMGYPARTPPYNVLIQAYLNAKTPAYGFRERMIADNFKPSKKVMADLLAVDAFKKTPVLDLLE